MSDPLEIGRAENWSREMPTMRLRFVEREAGDLGAPRTIRILQQMWIIETWVTTREEWRDVPLEVE
jgi:hypothetical protein